jgi:alpha-ketoglutarate-dependent taurine dioxygenase
MAYQPSPVAAGGSRFARRAVTTTATDSLIRARYLSPDMHLPLVIEPASDQVDALQWAANAGEYMQTELLRHGAILFRNFPLPAVEKFHHFVRIIAGDPLEYKERSSPRSSVGENIYTSTDYPADQSIFPHNEHSYSNTFPLKLFFWCDVPAREGGETPLGDTRRVYERVPPEIREKFAAKGWMFVRNFNSGFGLPWQTVFQTEDRNIVEEYCSRNDIEWEWRGKDKLRTRQVRPAIAQHPYTKEFVWFNHATFFHITTMEKTMVEVLRAEFAEDELPNNTFYGDGTPIPDETVEALREAYRQEMIKFPWQSGDVVLIDNMLTAHARSSFAGPRRILVAMAEPFTRQRMPHSAISD